jgi:hypothetical protein
MPVLVIFKREIAFYPVPNPVEGHILVFLMQKAFIEEIHLFRLLSPIDSSRLSKLAIHLTQLTSPSCLRLLDDIFFSTRWGGASYSFVVPIVYLV